MAANFENLCSFKVLDSIPVTKYRSKKTGIQLCFAQVPGPLVNGYLCLCKQLCNDIKFSVSSRENVCYLSLILTFSLFSVSSYKQAHQELFLENQHLK